MRKRPTKSELEILSVLWERGPSSVREVHDDLSGKRPTGYTTVLKLMQIMAEKGLVSRDEEARAHVYCPVFQRSDTQRDLVDDLADRAFGGSAHRLALHVLSRQKSSPEELEEIKALLKTLEEQA